jgi:hypothetical protein
MRTQEIKAQILRLLEERGAGKTICPSEVARAVARSNTREAWEPLMGPVREAAFAMADGGVIAVIQKGKVLDGRTAKGPLRLRLR